MPAQPTEHLVLLGDHMSRQENDRNFSEKGWNYSHFQAARESSGCTAVADYSESAG
jgi:hypothetical protein